MTPSPGWSTRMADAQRRICEQALALFLDRGFDHVTIAEIAAAAGVGERTVYRHFRTKEQIVLGDASRDFARLAEALRSTPADAAITEAAARAERLFLTDPDDVEVDRIRMTLLRSTPALQMTWLQELRAMEEELSLWIAARRGRAEAAIEDRVAAAALVVAHRIATDAWDGTGMDSYLTGYDRALALLAPSIDAH